MSTPATERREWTRYLDTHYGHVGLAPDHPLRDVELDANFVPHLPRPTARILEIGFGQGTTLRQLAARGYRDLTGWDISLDCVQRARDLGVPASLEHIDAFDGFASSPPDAFDAILAKEILEHLPRERVVEFVEGVHRILRPGGVFLARIPNMANPLAVLLRYDDFTHTLGFTESSVRQVFALGGFHRDDVTAAADVLPAAALLRRGLLGSFVAEKLVGPLVRSAIAAAVWSQRKAPPAARTLRLVIAARKR